jgi:hypothetical protein
MNKAKLRILALPFALVIYFALMICVITFVRIFLAGVFFTDYILPLIAFVTQCLSIKFENMPSIDWYFEVSK